DSLAYIKLSLGSSVYRGWKLVDTSYRALWDTAYWGFLGLRTRFDIFQNILLLYYEYGVLISPGYNVLGLQSFVYYIRRIIDVDTAYSSKSGVDITAKTRRPQPRSNTKNDRVPSASKSSCIKNKEVKVEEHHRNLLLSKNKEHMSSECNNVKLAIQNDKSEVICAM
ncbi:hypothetical protein Tco_1249177, partial [Tanacetum coccineum]